MEHVIFFVILGWAVWCGLRASDYTPAKFWRYLPFAAAIIYFVVDKHKPGDTISDIISALLGPLMFYAIAWGIRRINLERLNRKPETVIKFAETLSFQFAWAVIAAVSFATVWGFARLYFDKLGSRSPDKPAAWFAGCFALVVMTLPAGKWYDLWKSHMKEGTVNRGRWKLWLSVGLITAGFALWWFLGWWYSPSVKPRGTYRVAESQGFGDTMKGVEIEADDKLVKISGPKFPGRELKILRWRRAFGADCAQDFDETGTMYWSRDPGTGMWQVRWDGFRKERTLLLQEK